MTVTVRPVPKRTYQNGIRPFRPVVPANNIRPYTVKTWRPPVPEPLPPAPLLGPKELLGLGVLVLAQIWGRLSSRPATSQSAAGPLEQAISGTIPNPGNTIGAPFTVDRIGGPFEVFNTDSCSDSIALGSGNFRVINTSDVVKVEFQPGTGSCGPNAFTWKLTFSNGTTRLETPASTTHGYKSIGFRHQMTWAGPNAVNYEAPTSPLPLPDGYQAPQVNPDTATTPRSLPPIPLRPIPLPGNPTVVPEPQPEADPLPAPGPGPSRRPVAPPIPKPAVPNAAPALPGRIIVVRPDGKLPAPAKDPVAITHPDAHFPVRGAPPVTGNGPRPTPEGIAQELGRLEQKLARLSDPGPEGPGDGSDRLQLISDLIERLIEFTTSMTSGGGYGLSSPCEVDESGERIVTTVNYPGATNSLGVLSNKVDALAALIQVHKDLKQPNCKQPAAVGQPVTVNFVQVD